MYSFSFQKTPLKNKKSYINNFTTCFVAKVLKKCRFCTLCQYLCNNYYASGGILNVLNEIT